MVVEMVVFRTKLVRRLILMGVVVLGMSLSPLWLFRQWSSMEHDNPYYYYYDHWMMWSPTLNTTSSSGRGGALKTHGPNVTLAPTKLPLNANTSSLEGYRIQTVENSPLLEYLTRKMNDVELEQSHDPLSSGGILGDPLQYQQDHCNLEGTDWCPSGDQAWTMGAPYFLVMGVKKSGTTSLFQFLLQHDKIVPGDQKELLFFTRRRFNFDAFLDDEPSKEGATRKVRVKTMRSNLQKRFPKVQRLAATSSHNINGTYRISFDATPQALFDWPSMKRPILCGMPWIKLLVITREPVDRLWSHYNFLHGVFPKRGRTFNLSFEQWILDDLKKLAKYGLLISGGANPNNSANEGQQDSNTNGSNRHLTDVQLAKAWDDYSKYSLEGQIGRGFYVSQLYQWFREVRRLGRDPKEAFRIVRLEDLKSDEGVASKLFAEITEWLGLDPSEHLNDLVFNQKMKSVYNEQKGKPVLSEHTRQILEDFYRPYNDLLAKLLDDPRWDYRPHDKEEKNSFANAVVWPHNKKRESGERGTSDEVPLLECPTKESLSLVPCKGRTIPSLLPRNATTSVFVDDTIREGDHPIPTTKRYDSSHLLEPYRIQSGNSPVIEFMRRQVSASNTSVFGNAAKYQQDFCNLEDGEWCPSGEDAWQQNAPAFLLLGVKKSGTTAFFGFLNQHPQVIPGKRKEIMFFNQRKFPYQKYIEDGDGDGIVVEGEPGGKIKVQTLRKDLLEHYHVDKLKTLTPQQGNISSTRRKISFGATPQYLYNWASTSRAILCSCPWVKLLVIVRNPTDRLWSHYNYVRGLTLNQRKKAMRLSFEEWLLLDFRELYKHGLIEKDGKHATRLETEADVARAWSEYTRETAEGPVGRNFYALSLHGWFQELRRMGRDPKEALKIVRLEDLSGNSTDVPPQLFNEIMDWLGVDKREYQTFFAQRMKTNYEKLGKPVLSESTKKLLDEFHVPYNLALAELLEDPRWTYKRSDMEASGQGTDTVVVWPPISQVEELHSHQHSFYFKSGGNTDVCRLPS